MKRLYDIQKETEALLEAFPDTRDSDDVLYYRFVHSINSSLTTFDLLMDREKYGLPPYESVRRTRQKLQEKRPELRGNRKVRQMRKQREDEFRAYAVND